MRLCRWTAGLHYPLLAAALAIGWACRDSLAPEGNVGPQGGRLELADGAVILDIPAGALTTTVDITVEPATAAPASDRLVPGTAYDFQPDGLQFAIPVILIVGFDPTVVPDGIRPAELRIHRAGGGVWQRLAESSADEAADQVMGTIDSFSTYGVLGVPVMAVTLTPSDVHLIPGATQQLNAIPLDEDQNPLPERIVEWLAEDETVATVDAVGLVTAVAVGMTTVTATSEGVAVTASVTVAEANAGPEGGRLELADGSVILDIPPGALDQAVLISAQVAAGPPSAPTHVPGTAFDMQPEGLSFASAATFTVTYDPADVPPGVRTSELRLYRVATNVWEEIAGSTPDGQANHVSADIDGFSVFGILGIPVASLELSTTDAELALGEALQLMATTRAADQSELPDRVVTWESDDPGVATVSAAGLVTAQGAGNAVITAMSERIEASAGITVVAPEAEPTLQVVANGLTQPVFVTAPPGDLQRVFIVEQEGRIRILRGGAVLPTPFLDIDAAVLNGGERGLLSMTFHPEYSSNGVFFVYYTNNQGNTRVVRYRASANPDVADAASGDTVLAVNQPASNHNGGLLAFGPHGYLHIGLGDGGGGGDPDDNGQDSTTLLGAILRIDVDGDAPYEIPADNPLLGQPDARAEIWAYGLRNPWRYSFDRSTGDLYIADVGQNQWEEVNVQPASSDGGENYGWNVMEGAHCFNAPSCNQAGLTLPVHEYNHSQGCSITGGYVYRGSVFPSLQGTYFYADYCEGIIRSFRYEGGGAVDHRNWEPEMGNPGLITSFGEDARGEIYVTTSNGRVHKMVPN